MLVEDECPDIAWTSEAAVPQEIVKARAQCRVLRPWTRISLGNPSSVVPDHASRRTDRNIL
jgi:hypothetical protein